MRCMTCGCDPNPIVIVPARQRNGAVEVFSCRACAIKAGVYCERHECSHLGFLGDNSTACRYCIDEEVQRNRDGAERIYRIIQIALPPDEWFALSEAAEESSLLTGDEDSVAVLRFMVTRAHRLHVSLPEVLKQIIVNLSVSEILPVGLF